MNPNQRVQVCNVKYKLVQMLERENLEADGNLPKIKCATILFSNLENQKENIEANLQCNYSEKAYSEFLDCIDKNTTWFTGTVWFEDGSWSETSQVSYGYGSSFFGSRQIKPEIPEKLL